MLSILLVAFALCVATASVFAQKMIEVNFDNEKSGQLPKYFSTALTGNGREGIWTITKDETSPAQKLVLAQTDADATSYRFPVCVYENFSAKDVDVSVRFKPVSGAKDQAAGLVWRYRDKDNYYIVRANALEDNVVLYKIQSGKREDLPLKVEGRTYGKKVPVPRNQWSELRVTAKASLFAVYLNGQKLYDVEDATFTDAGKIGVWTKADSITYFDDLKVMSQ